MSMLLYMWAMVLFFLTKMQLH